VIKRSAIILAAGKGVRMRSSLPKALCELSGRPMVDFSIDMTRNNKIKDIVVVGGYKIDLLKKKLSSEKVTVLKQNRLLGSADAVKVAKKHFAKFKGTILVLYGDTPLIKSSTIRKILKKHETSKSVATILTVKTDDPKEYGQIARDNKKNICGIIEYTERGSLYTKSRQYEINVGAYCFDSKRLFKGLDQIKKNKKKNEFYLTDIISLFHKKGYPISSFSTKDMDEALGVNRKRDLVVAEKVLKERNIDRLLDSGVTIKDPDTVFVGQNAKIAKDVIIYPFVVIENDVIIGRGCKVGPFVHLRRGTVLKPNAVVGNFVEVARSIIGEGSRAKHHSYLGDTIVGKNVNIGAGTITANYDGRSKNKTIVDDNAFIGSGTTIVAPVKIGKKATTGAGSVVVKGKDVAPGATVVGVPAKALNKKQ